MRVVKLGGAVVMLCLASGAPVALAGCGAGTLARVELPADGVVLRYGLEPGGVVEGHVMERGVTVTPEGDVHRLVEYDVTLAPSLDATSDRTAIDVSFSNVQLDLRLTRIRKHAANVIHVSDLPRLIEETEQRLERSRVQLVFDGQGLLEAPRAPDGLAEPAGRLVGAVLRTLSETLVRLPEDRLQIGSAWVEGEAVEGRFDGLFTQEGNPETVARLRIDGSGEVPKADRDQPRRIDWTTQTRVLFAVDAGYPTFVESQRRVLDPIGGDGTFKLTAEFERARPGP